MKKESALQKSGSYSNNALVGLLSLWLLFESGYGLLQVLGIVTSGHAFFPLTGNFSNPGPFGGFIAMLMAVSAAYVFLYPEDSGGNKWVRILALIAFAVGFLVLPASMSRAGWMGLGVALLFLALNNRTVRVLLNKKLWLWVVACVVGLILVVGGISLKKDSALGRLHIWRIETRILVKHPFSGVGPDHFATAYGQEQALFFSEKERPADIVRVAGCPEYAFNEYLKIGVMFGVGGLLLAISTAIAVCWTLIRRRHPLGYGALALAVFALFSYPFSLWQFQLCGGLFLTAAVCEWLGKKQWIGYSLFALIAGFLFLVHKNGKGSTIDYRDLYRDGHYLFEAGLYDEAIPVLEQGADLSCDPMFHNILGRCHEALGNPEEAEKEYLLSHFMVPGRLYPLVLLQELYLSQEDTLRAREMLMEIRKIPVNEKNRNMVLLRERAERHDPVNPIPENH